MTAKPFSLQDQFLNSARRSKVPLTIFLLKGVKLLGVLTWFDSFSLLIRREGQSQLVYKHSVSTIMPAAPLQLDEPPVADSSGKPGLQDAFLSAAEQEEQSVTMFLVNGVMLEGHVVQHDQFSLLLERDDKVQLVYKHSISTIQPRHPLMLNAEAAEGGK